MNLEGITTVHGELWTTKEMFVYPNEFILWSIQIVMYPYMTGLVAGAFVLSSLYHVFGQNQLKKVATFSLAFSFCLLPVAMHGPTINESMPMLGGLPLLKPVIGIILAVLVFGGLWGFWGVFFAIPLATLIKAIINAWPTADVETIEKAEIATQT